MKKILKYLHIFLESNKRLAGLLLFLFSLIFFVWVQNPTTFTDPDSFYHIKISRLIYQNGIIYDFPWLQATVLKENYIDHHFIFHLLMAPFVVFLPPILGAKIFQALMASLAILVFFLVLSRLKIKGALYWSLILFSASSFIFRISLVKAPAFSLIFVLLGIGLVANRRLWLLFFLSFLYVWSYGGWFLMLAIAGAYAAADGWQAALADQTIRLDKWRASFKKNLKSIQSFFVLWLKKIFSAGNIKLIAAVSAGLTAGLVLNPYFPKNLKFYWAQIVQIGLFNFQSKIQVGGEWYPVDFLRLFPNGGLPFIFFLVGVAAFLALNRHFKIQSRFFFILATLFFFASLKAQRNLEYFLPFSAMFGAFSLSELAALPEIKNFASLWKKTLKSKIIFALCGLMTILLTLVLFAANPIKTKLTLKSGDRIDLFQNAAGFLKDNTPAGSIVFNSNWDDFPALFYQNDRNYYLTGLDPTFMYLKNPALYQRYEKINKGEGSEEARLIIKNELNAEYVVAGAAKNDLIRMLENNFYFEKIYADDEAAIFKVL